MIKILFIHRRMDCGGVEQALFDLINLLDKDLFDVTVLLQKEGGEWEQKFLDSGIRLTHIYSCQKVSRNPLVKALNLIKRKQLDKAWKHNGRGILATALPGHYDLIVNFGSVSFEEMSFYGSAKTIKYIHGDPGTNQPYREYVQRSIDVLRMYDRIVCVSEQACCSFKNLTGITDSVVCLFNPLNSDGVKQKSAHPVTLPRDLPLLCAVGRLSPEKGFDRLVRIHKNLLDKGIEHRLVIVGEGSEREKIQQTIRATGTEESVILAGYQSNPYPYMAHSSFMVCSSYTEGLPVIAMEALSLGIPIVSAIPSIGEIFGPEACGIITENDDAGLEAGIERMLTDPDFYTAARQAAQRRSLFFDGQQMVKETVRLFTELLN